MKVEENWRLIAQSIGAMADHLSNAVGYALTPILFEDLPAVPAKGMICCISDSTVNAWGSIISVGGGVGAPPGTTFAVLAWYNGAAWTVIGK